MINLNNIRFTNEANVVIYISSHCKFFINYFHTLVPLRDITIGNLGLTRNIKVKNYKVSNYIKTSND